MRAKATASGIERHGDGEPAENLEAVVDGLSEVEEGNPHVRGALEKGREATAYTFQSVTGDHQVYIRGKAPDILTHFRGYMMVM